MVQRWEIVSVTVPSLLLGFIIATLCGAVFHLLLGGDVRRFALYLLAGWLGFAVGQVFGLTFGLDLFAIGPLQTGAAVIGAVIALATAYVLGIRLQNSG